MTVDGVPFAATPRERMMRARLAHDLFDPQRPSPSAVVTARLTLVAILFAVCCAASASAQTARAFERVSDGTVVSGGVTAIAVSPVDPRRVYFGTDSGDLWASDDGGDTWTPSTLSPWDGRPARPRPAWFNDLSLTAEAHDSRRIDPSSVFDFRGAFDSAALFGGIRQQLDQLSAGRLARETFDDGFGRTESRRPHDAQAASTRRMSLYRSSRAVLDGSIHVAWIEAHPTDATRALATTSAGVWATDDGGLSWQPVFDATTDTGTPEHAAWNPWNDREIFVASTRGLFISSDGGVAFYRSPDGVLTYGHQNMVAFHPEDPLGYLVVGGSVWRHSEDRLHAIRTGWGWREAVDVTVARVRPGDVDTIVLGTTYGLLVSRDAGDRFAFATEPMLYGSAIVAVAMAPDGMRAAVTTGLDVWETSDFERWELVWSGAEHDRIHHLAYADDGRGTLWMASTEGVRRMWIGEPWELPTEQHIAWVQARQSWPTMAEAIRAAHQRLAIERDRVVGTERRARNATLLPRVEVAWFRHAPTADADLFSQSLGAGVGDLQRLYGNGYRNTFTGVAGMITWDLSRLMLRHDALQSSHGLRELVAVEHRTRDEVTRLHTEHARLVMLDLIGAGDVRACVMRRVRLQQVRAQLNLLTDDLYRAAERASPALGACQ